MAKKVIIFGSAQTAQLAEYYLTNDSKYEVDAFTTDNPETATTNFSSKPLVPFHELPNIKPPSDFVLFAPMMATNVNRNRLEVFERGKLLGYKFISYISTNATILTSDIGENCFILENNVIQPFTKVSDNTIIWSGNHIGHHSRIDHSCFITSHCVISGNVKIGARSYLGVNSSIVDNAHVEEGVMLTMNSALTSKIAKAGGVYSGSPAKLHPKLKSENLLK